MSSRIIISKRGDASAAARLLTVVRAQAAVEAAEGRVCGGRGAAARPVDLPVLDVLQAVLAADVVGDDLQTKPPTPHC